MIANPFVCFTQGRLKSSLTAILRLQKMERSCSGAMFPLDTKRSHAALGCVVALCAAMVSHILEVPADFVDTIVRVNRTSLPFIGPYRAFWLRVRQNSSRSAPCVCSQAGWQRRSRRRSTLRPNSLSRGGSIRRVCCAPTRLSRRRAPFCGARRQDSTTPQWTEALEAAGARRLGNRRRCALRRRRRRRRRRRCATFHRAQIRVCVRGRLSHQLLPWMCVRVAPLGFALCPRCLFPILEMRAGPPVGPPATL
jgi:hypothetical protein